MSSLALGVRAPQPARAAGEMESHRVLLGTDSELCSLGYLSTDEMKGLDMPEVARLAMSNNEIDHTCEDFIHLAVSAMELSKTSVDRRRLAALEAAVVGLDHDMRVAIVEHLDSPGRFQRINAWAQLVQGAPATVRRRIGRFARAMTRVLAIEIVWRLAANKELPSFLA